MQVLRDRHCLDRFSDSCPSQLMDNPYQVGGVGNPVGQNQGQVSTAVVDVLRRTKGWARFVAVIGFIISGFMILFGIGMMFFGAAMGNEFGAAGFGAMLGLVYIALSIIYLYPAIKLNQYASRIGNLLNSGMEMDLVSALDAQRSVWKFIGIFMIVILSIYLIIFLLAGVMTAAA